MVCIRAVVCSVAFFKWLVSSPNFCTLSVSSSFMSFETFSSSVVMRCNCWSMRLFFPSSSLTLTSLSDSSFSFASFRNSSVDFARASMERLPKLAFTLSTTASMLALRWASLSLKTSSASSLAVFACTSLKAKAQASPRTKPATRATSIKIQFILLCPLSSTFLLDYVYHKFLN